MKYYSPFKYIWIYVRVHVSIMLNLHRIPWHDKLLKKSYFSNHNTIYIERILFKKVYILLRIKSTWAWSIPKNIVVLYLYKHYLNLKNKCETKYRYLHNRIKVVCMYVICINFYLHPLPQICGKQTLNYVFKT